MTLMMNPLKRSVSVAGLANCYSRSLRLRHNIPTLFKAAESSLTTSRSFQTTNFRFSDENTHKAKEESCLDRAAADLSVDIAKTFLERITIDNYHPQVRFTVFIVLSPDFFDFFYIYIIFHEILISKNMTMNLFQLEVDDRIRGVKYTGLALYLKDLNLTKIRAHIKFVYVRPKILSLVKHEEDRTIHVDWRHVGVTTLRLVVRYIPDQLWFRDNMDKAAIVWAEGSSTYYLDENYKICKLILDKYNESSDEDSEQ